MIGFCGEFLPDEKGEVDFSPGKFYNSWAFEDRGRLYVDGQWDTILSQRGVSSSFEQGDTITVFWKAPTTTPDAPVEAFYSKKSKNSKRGVEFRSDGEGEMQYLRREELS